MKPASALLLIKLSHTAAWVFFAACVVLLPVAAYLGKFGVAAALAGFVTLETAILAMNRWACPLTAIAARYTDDRSDNFDIFLPRLLARYNKQVFGTLFVVGAIYALSCWWRQAGA